MTFGKQAAHRLRELLSEGKWVAGTNYKLQLQDLNLAEATKQISDLNTIAKLTYHVGYYLDGLARFFDSGKLDIRDKYSFDLPDLKEEKDWEQVRSNFFEYAERFTTAVEKMDDEQAAQIFVDEKYGDYRRNINAMIEHCYYHLGQIVMLRKLVDATDS